MQGTEETLFGQMTPDLQWPKVNSNTTYCLPNCKEFLQAPASYFQHLPTFSTIFLSISQPNSSPPQKIRFGKHWQTSPWMCSPHLPAPPKELAGSPHVRLATDLRWVILDDFWRPTTRKKSGSSIQQKGSSPTIAGTWNHKASRSCIWIL